MRRSRMSASFVTSTALFADVLFSMSSSAQEAGEDKSWPVPVPGIVIKSGSNTLVSIRDVGIILVGDTFSVTNSTGVFEFRLTAWTPDGIKCDRLKSRISPPPEKVQPPLVAEEIPKAAGPRNPFSPIGSTQTDTNRAEAGRMPY